MFNTIAHVATLFYHIQVLRYVGNIQVQEDSNDEVKQFIEFKPKYFTHWCFATQTLLFALCVVHDVTRVFPESSPLRRGARWAKDLIFCSLAAPLALDVAGVFWALSAVDRELVLPAALDVVVPSWLNHALHTNIAVLVFVELLAEPHTLPGLVPSVGLLAAYTLAYLVTLLGEYNSTGRWLYPVLALMDWPLRLLFLAVNVATPFLLHAIWRKLVGSVWAWGADRTVPVIKKTNSKKRLD